MDRNEELFRKAPIPKAFMTLCMPVVLGMIVGLLYNMADTYFVGRMNDADQMAAVSLCAPMFIILMGLGNIFGIGGSSVISRMMGEKKNERARTASAVCFWGSILTGVIMLIVLQLCMPFTLSLMGASVNTSGYAASYLRIIVAGAPFILMSFMLMNTMRCDGAAKQSMFGSILGSVVNILLDPLMILVLKMGVTGAALATVVGYISQDIYYCLYVTKHSKTLSLNIKEAKPDAEIVTGVLSIGLPASITNILASVSNIYLNNLLLPYGDTAIAAMGIALKINNIVTLLQVGFAAGLPPIIGYNYGAGDKDRMNAVLKSAFLFVTAVGTVLSVAVFIVAKPFTGLFIANEEIVSFGTAMLRALMLCGPFLGVQFIMTNYFQATGKALPALLLSLCRQGIIFLLVLTAMKALFGWTGILYAQAASDYITLIIASVLFLKVAVPELKK